MGGAILGTILGIVGQQQKRRRRRIACEEQNWRCYYCGEKMVEPEQNPRRGYRHKPNEATLEHLDDRFSEERGQHPGEIRTVAACWQCNFERGKRRQEEQGIKELHRRSRRGNTVVGDPWVRTATFTLAEVWPKPN